MCVCDRLTFTHLLSFITYSAIWAIPYLYSCFTRKVEQYFKKPTYLYLLHKPIVIYNIYCLNIYFYNINRGILFKAKYSKCNIPDIVIFNNIWTFTPAWRTWTWSGWMCVMYTVRKFNWWRYCLALHSWQNFLPFPAFWLNFTSHRALQ